MKQKYKNYYNYRGLPCTVGGGKFAVQGTENVTREVRGTVVESTGSGILEWCRSKEDAESRLAIMKQYEQFSNLSVYIDESEKLEHGLIIQEDEKYLVRISVRKCQCDTMEKVYKCPFSVGIDECCYGKYGEFPIAPENMNDVGPDKTHQDRDGVYGKLTEDKTFLIVSNHSHERRLAPVIEVETYQDKLKKLVEKYNV